MSKSAGNVIPPQKIIDQFGAEVLRLWVASENYREDIRLSQEILKRLTEAYRKIRNTFRYFLGNLHDFDPSTDQVAFDDLLEIDRYILHRHKLLVEKILQAYENYEFHVFYQSFYKFCVVDLSNFYLDILKDRLYTFPKASKERRSGQTALYILLRDMSQLMAPVLSFTAEEVWSHLPGTPGEKSVHQSLFPDVSELRFADDLIGKWEMLVALKGEVSKALELCRQEKVIGHSLDAVVYLVLPENIRAALKTGFEDELQFIFIVSEVELVKSLDNETNVYKSELLEGLEVLPKRMGGQKCERCWNYFLEPALAPEHTGICPRCVTNLQSATA